MKTLRVPATTANLGSGFDSIGIALSLYNYVTYEASDRIIVDCSDDVPLDENNLIIRCIAQAFKYAGRAFNGVHIIQENNVPLARGLGSSSTCVTAGVAIANDLMGGVFSKQDMVTLAASIEGHPDNVAPAILGGFVAAVIDQGEVHYIRKELNRDSVAFVAVVPDFMVSTEEARAALPKQFTMDNAVFNLSRAALLTAAFITENYGLLRVASDDNLHQQHRLKLVRGGEDILRKMLDCGAYCSTVSGSGPSLLATVPGDGSGSDVFEGIKAYVDEFYPTYQVIYLQADNDGLVIT